MATGDLQSRNPLDSIQGILNIFRGAPGTTQTTTENVSNDKAKSYIQQILEGNSGLAAVSSGQKAAGMYGSTVNTQLTNDLLSRTAAQTAALSSNKTSTVKGNAQLDPLKTLLSAGIGQMATPLVKTGAKKLGIDQWGNKISDAVFGGPGSDAVSNAMDTPNIGAFSPTNLPIDTGAFSNFSDLAGMGASESNGSSGMGLGDMAGVAGGTAALGSMLGAGGTAAALTDASFAIGGTGTFMAADAAATAATAATGAEVAATAATAAEGAGAFDAIATAAVALWIICTELNKQGRLPNRYYIYGAREFAKYDERGKQGYYIWAIPSVKHLRKHPYSTYSKLLEVVFNARAEYLAAKAGCKGARKTVLGFATTHGLYGFCWILSRTIARKPVTREHILGIGA